MQSSPFLRLATVLGCLAIASCSVTTNNDSTSGGEMTVPPGVAHQQAIDEALAGLDFTDVTVTVDPSRESEAGTLDETELRALIEEAETHIARGRGVQAAAVFTRYIISAPERAVGYEGLGRALIREGRSLQALAALRSALQIEPEWTDVRFAVGTTLHRLDRLDEAVEIWRGMVERDPAMGDAHGRLAVGYYLLGSPELSRHHLKRAETLGGAVPAQLATMLDTGRPPSAEIRIGHDAGEGATEAAVSIGDQVRINTNGGTGLANETTCVAIDERPGVAVAGWNSSEGSGYRVGVGVTHDGGLTWDNWEITSNNSYCDAMTVGDSRTGNLWIGGLDQNMGIFVSKKITGTAAFEPANYAGAADKPWIAAGPRPGEPDSTRMYVAANIDFARSDDLGETWNSPSVSMSGIGHLPRVGPEGELYIAYWDLNYGVKLQRSFDGGDTLSSPITIATRLAAWDIYDAPMIPGGFRVPPLTYLAVDQNDGTVYCVYWDVTEQVGVNRNVDLYFTRSKDQGTTWTIPTVLPFDPSSLDHGDQFFSWLEVDNSGRLHLLFLDTRNTAQNDSSSTAFIDAYYAWSENSGDTWTEHRLTPAPYNTGGASSFLGDYMGMGVGHNRVYPVYPQVSGGVNQIMSNPIVWVENPDLFNDDFESGDMSAWSQAAP